MKKLFLLFTLITLSATAFARDQIKIVGSSTVYPFTTVVAEKHDKKDLEHQLLNQQVRKI